MHKHKSKGVKDLKVSWSRECHGSRFSVSLLAHSRCYTNVSTLPWAGWWKSFHCSRNEGPNVPAFCTDSPRSLLLSASQEQSQSSDNMFCLEPREVRWKSRMCPCSYCSFLSLIFFAWGLTERCLQDSDLEFCCWGDRMRSCDLCLGTPEVAGWTAPNPRQSRRWAGGLQLEKVLFLLSLSLLISHFLFFWLISSSWNSLQFPPMTSPNISHHTVTWTTETLTSFTLCSSGWQPV